MAKRRNDALPALSDAEWKVMRALWARHPATARELLAALTTETGWAYTTLRTLLARLVEKGAVSESKEDGTSVYEPLLREDRARSTAVRSLLERAFDGGFGSLVHFMLENEELSSRDRTELERMLLESKKKGSRS
ncbi:MAG: BlaI/MecI/CopY family transcriptional regulator [Planctomycetes bacterium]|nr:BlaI/MecI/CopY family transcriptional regulator [Planctomycetota bacterium]